MPNRTIIRATVTRRNGEAVSPAPIMRENFQKQRPLNIEPFPDPLAALDWNHAVDGAVTRLWDRLSLPVAVIAWSAFCFLLGWLL